jgi:mRNA deadenylase 3'-5' endonuclease subunit Ccr4
MSLIEKINEEKINSKNIIKIVSYNVLSSELSDPTYYTRTNKIHLNQSNRFKKLITKIKVWCENETIICFQEISRTWLDKLDIFFRKNTSYHLVSSSYGWIKNGYMGCLIAFPKKYNYLSRKVYRLSDSIQTPNENKKRKSICNIFNYFQKYYKFCYRKVIIKNFGFQLIICHVYFGAKRL